MLGALVRAARSPLLTGWRPRALLRPAEACARACVPRGLRPIPIPAAAAAAGYCSSCWRCGAAPEPPGFFCSSCRALQPPDRRLDYFQLLGLPRRFPLDPGRLREAHRRLQRALHPDNFGRSSDVERRYSQLQSALLNQAFAALLRPLSRGLYLLELELPDEPPAAGEAEAEAEADPALLGAVLELNERLAEAENQADLRRVAASVEARLRELEDKVVVAFEQGRPRDARPLLLQMKYWNSIGDRVKERLLPR